MQMAQVKSKYAPPERLDEPEIRRQSHLIRNQAFLSRLYEAVMNAVVIVNQQRQIVYSNRIFASVAGFGRPEDIYGLRPGEAIGCVHADEEDGGCGTAAACAFCGAEGVYLDEVVTDDQGGRMFVCSDTDYCAARRGERTDA